VACGWSKCLTFFHVNGGHSSVFIHEWAAVQKMLTSLSLLPQDLSVHTTMCAMHESLLPAAASCCC
jgi:hypothetical protein